MSQSNTDPGFDVQKFVKIKFNKENHFERGDTNESSVSFKQLSELTGVNYI